MYKRQIVSKPHFKDLNGIFHCFDSDYEDAMKLIDLGFLLGIGGILTFKNSNLRETIAKIGIEKLVLETDSPYLSPEPYRGKRNEPANILYIAEKLEKITSIPLTKIQPTVYTSDLLVPSIFKIITRACINIHM